MQDRLGRQTCIRQCKSERQKRTKATEQRNTGLCQTFTKRLFRFLHVNKHVAQWFCLRHSLNSLDLHANSRGLIEICKGVQSAMVYASQKGTLPGRERPLCFLWQNRMEKRTRDEPSIPALLRSSALRRSDLHCLIYGGSLETHASSPFSSF